MPVPSSRFGYLWDVSDGRDRPLAAARPAGEQKAPAERISFKQQVIEVLDQGPLGSCVAHGVLGAIRLKHVLSGIQKPVLGNRLHIYWGARAALNTITVDSGSNIRDAFKFINKFGYMPEKETAHGYNISKFKEGPSPLEQHKMFDQKQKGDGQVSYYRLFGDGEDRIAEIKSALSNGIIPVLGTDTTSAFLRYKGGLLRRPDEDARRTGGHCVYACGYDAEGLEVVNSWSEDFGDEGFMKLSWDYITWHRTRDIWGVDKAPYFSHLRRST